MLKIFRGFYGGYTPNYAKLAERGYKILNKLPKPMITISNSDQGFGQVKGTTKKQNAIYANVQVCLFKRSTRQLLWETKSKSDGSYSCIYTIDNNYFTSKSFKEVEAMLTYSNFIRVHRSYLVNKNFVKGFKSEEYKLELITGELVPVSDALFKKKELIDAFTS